MNVKFLVEGELYTLADMLQDNDSDTDFCDWLVSANVGDRYPSVVSCERVPA
jgi:hypothetical protein